jgi:hypothetical protein
MRIEHLFGKLESKTSMIFTKIRAAVANGLDSVDILEKDIHILFKFMNLSDRRSKQYRDDIVNPYRENDCVFQLLFDAFKKSKGSDDPGQFWLEHLLHLLETSHEDLISEARKTNETSAADTYKFFVENYSLQIWKAANGHEFFLNERLVDFEGDTQSFLGTEKKESRSQLTWMTTEDKIHLILPISPLVAIIFCDESRCWESPIAEHMHRLKIPYPNNSLLKNAPHKDIINVHVPAEKRGKKTWPETMAWRVSIGTLCRDHHRIITSYSLGHAESFVVVQHRARFERAKRDLEVFNKERCEVWKRRGTRFGYEYAKRKCEEENESQPPSQEQLDKIVKTHMCALEDVVNTINNTHEPLQRTKENALKSWLAIRALECERLKYPKSSSKMLEEVKTLHFCVLHPALKVAIEAAYPPKHPDHRDLITITFDQFLEYGIGDHTYAKLAILIESKMSELVCAESFHAQWETAAPELQVAQGSQGYGDENLTEASTQQDKDLLENPAFKSVYMAAQVFDTLKWFFEERQDILATFVQQIGVPMESTQPRVTRIRARRE